LKPINVSKVEQVSISIVTAGRLQQFEYPFTGNLFIGFKEALGYRESENKYKTVNSLGYLGKYHAI
jgi:hypothetical protein